MLESGTVFEQQIRLLSVDPVIKIHLIPLRKLFLFRSISDDLVLTRTFIICRSNDQIDFVPVRIPFVFRSNFDDLVLRRTFTFCRPNDLWSNESSITSLNCNRLERFNKSSCKRRKSSIESDNCILFAQMQLVNGSIYQCWPFSR